MIFYRGLRTNPEVVEKALKMIEDSIVEYIHAGIKSGAKMGLCTSKSVVFSEEMTYGQALCNLLSQKSDVGFVGHRCIKQMPFL